jgi:hypothetical protein
MDCFYIIINNAKKDSWSECVWSDVKDKATIYLDNNLIRKSFLKTIKKVHFSNQINNLIRLPLKQLWDFSLCLKITDLNSTNRNYIIFQNNIKFSPSFIKKLKREKNSYIVLYLYDTVERMGIGKSTKQFNTYCKYYHVDAVFSFDQNDVRKYGLRYFDLYSSLFIKENSVHSKLGLFYIGGCRSQNRLNILHTIYEKLHSVINCDFNIADVSGEHQKYVNEITYNKPLKYSEVLEKVNNVNTLLEITNENQEGYTIRFKEAVCFNKKLLTNNQAVKHSSYYNPKYIYIYDNIESIDSEWLLTDLEIDYRYKYDFSPLKLLEVIQNTDQAV